MIKSKIKKINKKKLQKEKIITAFIYGILIFALIVLFFTAKSMFFSKETSNQVTSQDTTSMPSMSKMSLTAYDKELGRKLMDKDNDGKCDVCGMDVNICIESGQMQCNMDSKSTIGILGSQHIHADFKVYVNGESINFANSDYYMKSSFIHVDDSQNKEDASGVLHMHAKGVPLWIFFKSIKLELPESTKIYVNGELNPEGLDYVFNPLDKILITNGIGNLEEQLNSITSFSQNHQK